MPNAWKWKMDAMCAGCPFSESEGGTRQRRALARGRMAEIKRALLNEGMFMCHKTTAETGNGTNLLCAGALEFQEEHGVSSNYQRVCENLDYFAELRAPK